MTKLLLSTLLSATMILSFAAEKQFDFEKIKKDEKGNAIPESWIYYRYFNLDCGSLGVSEDSASGDFAMELKAKADVAYKHDSQNMIRVFYGKHDIKARSGNVVKLEFSVKGIGELCTGFYTDDKKRAFVGSVSAPFQQIDSKEYIKKEFSLTVPENRDKEINFIRPFFYLKKGGSVLVDDLKITVDPAK